jgi:hypothetical protein
MMCKVTYGHTMLGLSQSKRSKWCGAQTKKICKKYLICIITILFKMPANIQNSFHGDLHGLAVRGVFRFLQIILI